jgi:hypothetical protein
MGAVDWWPCRSQSIGRALEELEVPAAAERKADGQRLGGVARQLGGNFTPSTDTGRVRDIIGAAELWVFRGRRRSASTGRRMARSRTTAGNGGWQRRHAYRLMDATKAVHDVSNWL